MALYQENWPLRCNNHFRLWRISISCHMTSRRRCFPRRSWVDLLHFLISSNYTAFHSRRSPNLSRLPLTSAIFSFVVSRIPGTFHPMRWSLASLRCPISKFLQLDSDPLYLALPKSHRLLTPALYSPLLLTCPSSALASTLKISLLK